MTGIDSYSTAASNNATATGGSVNWAEGQAAQSVNNSARQNMADLRSAFNDLMWFQYGTGTQGSGNIAVPAVYASGTSFTIAGVDVTSVYHAGRRVRAVGSSTGTIYGSISSSSFSTNTTVNVTWDSGSLSNETLVISLAQIPVTGTPVPAAAKGTITNDNAAAGNVGEFASSEIPIASEVTLTTGTIADVTSVSLTAGDWNVWGVVCFDPGGTTTLTRLQGWINTTSATAPTLPSGGAEAIQVLSGQTTSFLPTLPIGMRRLSLSATTTVYLSTIASFGTSTLKAFGGIYARRMR